RRIASLLEELNRDRQAVEEQILREASRVIDAWPEAQRRRRGYVVAGEDWHEGVIGIVASRLAERYHRPVVLIAGGEGDWKGSGRSIPAFDLHGGLAAVGEGKHLRFRVRDRGRPAGSAIAFGLGSQLDRYRIAGHYDLAFRLQENTWNGTTAPQLVVRRIFETPERYFDLRDRLADEWRTQQLSPEAETIFAELGLAEEGTWRSLLESETFRALLEEPVELRAAA